MPPYLSVVMPAYNEEQDLAPNATRLIGALSELGVDFELVIVDDGSHDATPQLADDLAEHDARVQAFHHAGNYGIGQALSTGFRRAQGEYTIFIPSDLAMRLDQLPKYLDAASEADIVVGLRSDRRDVPLVRQIISWANIALVRFLFQMPIRQFQYICMYRTRCLDQIPFEYSGSAFFQAEILIKARDMGCALREVEIDYAPRASGTARGARGGRVVKSLRDLFHFWARWLLRGWSQRGRRDWHVDRA